MLHRPEHGDDEKRQRHGRKHNACDIQRRADHNNRDQDRGHIEAINAHGKLLLSSPEHFPKKRIPVLRKKMR
jgi:hypothetical protein